MTTRLRVRVRTVTDLTPRIRFYELVAADVDTLPSFTAGAHIWVHLPSGRSRQYSLCNDSSEVGRYCIAVQREDAGRGGSREVHDTLSDGQTIEISPPHNLFPLSGGLDEAILIAGGIGITPIISMARSLERAERKFRLIYLARDVQSAAFVGELTELIDPERIAMHFDGGDAALAFPLRDALDRARPGTHVYCCGPTRLMDAVRAATQEWPRELVHFEYFSNDTAVPIDTDSAFSVELARSGRLIHVEAGQSILDALLDHGVEVEFSCMEGTCGTCIVTLLEGEVDHRDKVLLPDEQSTKIAICCSRAKSPTITLDI